MVLGTHRDHEMVGGGNTSDTIFEENPFDEFLGMLIVFHGRYSQSSRGLVRVAAFFGIEGNRGSSGFFRSS